MTAAEVDERLARLRVLYEPEHIDAARERLAREVPKACDARETFTSAVARRLDELRALDALTRHLQQRS